MLLAFQGISRPVSLVDSADVAACLPAVLRGWRFPEFPFSPPPPAARPSDENQGFVMPSCPIVDYY